MDKKEFSFSVEHALERVSKSRQIVADHLRQIARNEGAYDRISGLPRHAREFLLAAAKIIEEDGRGPSGQA